MIYYQSGGLHFFLNLFKLRGSIYQTSLVAAVPCALLSAFIRYLVQIKDEHVDEDCETEPNTNGWDLQSDAMWAGFSSLLGFLIVFRTSQGYARFWSGCTALHRMKGEWFEACSSLVAFCRCSNAEVVRVAQFEQTVVRLFGVLMAVALGEIEDTNISEVSEVEAFKYEVIGAGDLDTKTLSHIRDSEAKVELVYQWIRHFVVQHIHGPSPNTNVLNIPPPILSRFFQEMANGMIAFHEAIQISSVPFPFPYAQACSVLLTIHWFLVPWVALHWTLSWWVAGLFTFIQVFILWSLNSIAVQIENPFGADANDLDLIGMQTDMNSHLEVLLSESIMQVPQLNTEVQLERMSEGNVTRDTLLDLWTRELEPEEESISSCLDGCCRCSLWKEPRLSSASGKTSEGPARSLRSRTVRYSAKHEEATRRNQSGHGGIAGSTEAVKDDASALGAEGQNGHVPNGQPITSIDGIFLHVGTLSGSSKGSIDGQSGPVPQVKAHEISGNDADVPIIPSPPGAMPAACNLQVQVENPPASIPMKSNSFVADGTPHPSPPLHDELPLPPETSHHIANPGTRAGFEVLSHQPLMPRSVSEPRTLKEVVVPPTLDLDGTRASGPVVTSRASSRGLPTAGGPPPSARPELPSGLYGRRHQASPMLQSVPSSSVVRKDVECHLVFPQTAEQLSPRLFNGI